MTIPLVLGRKIPPLAEKISFFSATTRAEVAAFELQQDPNPAAAAAAVPAAVAALVASPINVAAVRTLGLAASLVGDQRRAAQAFSFSEKMSRRDLPTQLWLIEAAVQRGQIARAIVHYDRALRTSRSGRDLLLPILVSAAADPAIANALARVVAQRPAWWSALVEQMLAQKSPPDALFAIMRAVRPQIDNLGERQLLQATLFSLGSSGAGRQAYILYRSAAGRNDNGSLLRDGGFEHDGLIKPFDWILGEDNDLGALRDRREDGRGLALTLVAENGRSGEVARQLLALQPGRYRLSATVADPSNDPLVRPAFAIACAGKTATRLAGQTTPPGSGPVAVSVDFAVPANCEAQWITIAIGSSDIRAGNSAWVDNVAIQSLG